MTDMEAVDRLKQVANPERDSAAFLMAKREWLMENELDTDTAYFDLPLDARSEIMRRAHSMVTK